MMWARIKEWVHGNKNNLLLILSASLLIGVGTALMGFFFPSFLVALSSFVILGVTPFSFLTSMSLPIALMALGSISTGLSMCFIPLGEFVFNQLMSIGQHVFDLINKEPEIFTGGPLYQNQYLQPKNDDSYDLESDDFENPLARFNNTTWPKLRKNAERIEHRSELLQESDEENDSHVSCDFTL